MIRLLPLLALLFLSGCQSGSDSVSPGTGVGGSTARFTIVGDTLFVAGATDVQAYDIATSSDPRKGPKTSLGFGVETIFPYRNTLFIGTQTGMHILRLDKTGTPRHAGFYAHVLSCDPVVVQSNTAYVTLRSGTACRNQTINSLDIIDITDVNRPRQLRSYPMTSPRGLAVDSTLLFVGEGTNGMRVFDVSNPTDIRAITNLPLASTFDVIALRNRLIVTGTDGIFQYSYTNSGQVSLLSQLPLQP